MRVMFYLDKDFIQKNKITHLQATLLLQIYKWIFGISPPRTLYGDMGNFFYISHHKVAIEDGMVSERAVSRFFCRLREIGIIENEYLEKSDRKNYIVFNWDIVSASIAKENDMPENFRYDWQEKAKKYKLAYNRYRSRKMPELLDTSEMNIKKPYGPESEAIAKYILIKHRNYFSNKVPMGTEQPTKTFINICHKIADIYNGHFVSSRYYPMNDKVFNNRQFDTEGWKEKILSVKGSWLLTRKLILGALKNFEKMYDAGYMPMNKQYLQTNLSLWFFDDSPNGYGQSQFVQSLKEPMPIQKKFQNNHAKEVKEKLSNAEIEAGKKLISLLPSRSNADSAWKHIRQICEWADTACGLSTNFRYFCSDVSNITGDVLPYGAVVLNKYYRFLKDKAINVLLNTLNIERSIDNEGPWSWFITESAKKHDFPIAWARCLDKDDMYDALREDMMPNVTDEWDNYL